MDWADTNGHVNCVSIGYRSMYHCEYSDDNVAIGGSALGNLYAGRGGAGTSTSSCNTAIGFAAGLGITTVVDTGYHAAHNTCIGYRSLGGGLLQVEETFRFGVDYTSTTAIGAFTDVAIDGSSSPTGGRDACTIIGYGARAGKFEQSVYGTTIIGAYAGYGAGDDCTIIGNGADVAYPGSHNEVVIGAGAIGQGQGTVTLGNTST